MMPIRPFYLGENPSSPSHFRPQSMSQANLSSPTQRSANSSPTQQKHAINRQSLPPQRVSAASPPTSAPPSARRIPEEVEPGSGDEDGDGDEDGSEDQPGRRRKGTMSKNFRFPPPNPAPPPPPVPALPLTAPVTPADKEGGASDLKAEGAESDMTTVAVVTPSSVEVPPPPPVEKERPLGSANDLDDDVGETEEISLN